MNKILSMVDRPILRPLLRLFIFINYLRKGQKIRKVNYIKALNKWYYKVGDFSFLSTSAGWASSYSFFLDQLKKIGCYQYVPKEGDIIIDIGAGLGEETIVFSHLAGKTGLVYSIEAHPRTFDSLKYIVEDNKPSNVSIFNTAISDKKEMIDIEDNQGAGDSYLGNTIGISSGRNNVHKVEAITLDEFVRKNNIKKIDFLRVNIEGAERLMLSGMNEVVGILQNAAISCHDFRYANGEGEFFKTKEEVEKFFKNNGFNISSQQTQNPVINDYVYATRKEPVEKNILKKFPSIS